MRLTHEEARQVELAGFCFGFPGNGSDDTHCYARVCAILILSQMNYSKERSKNA